MTCCSAAAGQDAGNSWHEARVLERGVMILGQERDTRWSTLYNAFLVEIARRIVVNQLRLCEVRRRCRLRFVTALLR